MRKILCATRGGEASCRTQDAAIALAKERGDETERAVRPDVVSMEMMHMGEFLLAMACERAQKQEVGATFILRHGRLRDELKVAAREEAVDLVVLGQPGGEESRFGRAGLEAFAAEIEAETGAEARIV